MDGAGDGVRLDDTDLDLVDVGRAQRERRGVAESQVVDGDDDEVVLADDGEATNNISPGLTDDATTFVAGELKDTGNTMGTVTLASDAFTEIEFAVQATANATDGGDYCFRLYDATNNKVLDTYINYAEVQVAAAAGTLTLVDHDAGQVSDKFTSAPSVTDVLFRFKLIRTPSVTITDIRAQYTTGSGVVNADVTAGALYRDNNDDGVVDGGDALLSSGIAGAGGELAFTALTEDPGLHQQDLGIFHQCERTRVVVDDRDIRTSPDNGAAEKPRAVPELFRPIVTVLRP